MWCHIGVCLVFLTISTRLVLCQEFGGDDLQGVNGQYDKRRLDRYNFFSTLGKRQTEEISNENDLEEKRALDYRLFSGSLGKRFKGEGDVDSPVGYVENGNDGNSPMIGDSKEVTDVEQDMKEYQPIDEQKRAMDSHMFSGILGKRMDSRLFAGQLGKRGRLDYRMFYGQLGKRLDNRMFFGRLGKRMDYRMFRGQLGKRRMDSKMFFGRLGKKSVPMDKRAYYYRIGYRGRPIYTQTRGMDRFSFAARLGKRDAR